VRADGHVTANQDAANADKFEVHVVKQGETLSQIAGEVLKNPRMWPQLWEQNEHIINPHWIYPDDKILIRPVTPLAEAKPPEAATPVAAPATVEAEPQPGSRKIEYPATAPAPPPAGTGIAVFDTRAPAPEVKFDDLYCSGFVRKAPIHKDLKAIARYDATGGVLTTDTDYVYLSQGSEDGIAVGNTYQVIRPTKTLTNPYGVTSIDRDLGTHYLDVAQVRVVMAQPDFSLARVMHSCNDAVEVGDILIPFEPVKFPQPPRPRPFSSTMKANGGIKGIIVSANTVLLNFGSTYQMSGIIPGVRGADRLGVTERGIATFGTIVYIDAGEDKNVKVGDLFIVYRYPDFDTRLFKANKDVKKIESFPSAIGELIILNVGERASTALVTYSTDGISLGDEVDLR
jgi:hypothetical protein